MRGDKNLFNKNPKDAAKHIIEFRERNGMRQDQLAEALGVTTQAIYRYERGDMMPKRYLKLALEMLELNRTRCK